MSKFRKHTSEISESMRTAPIICCALLLCGCDRGPAPDNPALPMPKAAHELTTLTNSLGMQFVLIPAGEFRMGLTDEDLEQVVRLFPSFDKPTYQNEQPAQHVKISRPFYFGRYEVTRSQFAAFVDAEHYQTDAEKNPKGGWGYNKLLQPEMGPEFNWKNLGVPTTDDQPVVNVSWNDAVAFCRWLSEKEKVEYRLPTEAEWEYACRGGTTTLWWTGNSREQTVEAGNVVDATATAKFPDWKYAVRSNDGYVFAAPVGKFAPNPFGLYDILGNVWEWCQDAYDPADYAHRVPAKGETLIDPTNAESKQRVVRGGSWLNDPRSARSSFRGRSDPDTYGDITGFRVVRVAPQ